LRRTVGVDGQRRDHLAACRRVFRQGRDTPGVAFKVTKIEPAEVPGWRKGNVEAALGEQKQDVPF
jgi:hypothetical protein